MNLLSAAESSEVELLGKKTQLIFSLALCMAVCLRQYIDLCFHMEMVKKLKLLFLCFSACEKRRKKPPVKREERCRQAGKNIWKDFKKLIRMSSKKSQKGDVVKK